MARTKLTHAQKIARTRREALGFQKVGNAGMADAAAHRAIGYSLDQAARHDSTMFRCRQMAYYLARTGAYAIAFAYTDAVLAGNPGAIAQAIRAFGR
jgi:hypothetical protein